MGQDPWMVGDIDAWVRLRRQLLRECQWQGVQPPEPRQVAAVLHAMADHTAIMQALARFRPEDTSFWPEATAIGRWFHALGDHIEEREDRG